MDERLEKIVKEVLEKAGDPKVGLLARGLGPGGRVSAYLAPEEAAQVIKALAEKSAGGAAVKGGEVEG